MGRVGFILCFCCWTVWATEKVQIAVLDLTGESSEVRQEVRTISDRLESELIKTEVFRLLERRRIHEILQEQGFQESGVCQESSCQVQMGQMLGVDQIVVGSVGKVGSVYSLNVRMVSVQTGEILQTQVADVQGDLARLLTQGCQKVAQGLAFPQGKAPEKRKKTGWIWGASILGVIALIAGVGYWFWGDDSEETSVVLKERSLQ